MIGNDIVDLNVALVQSNWRRKRFMNKVFTEYEQGLISSSNNPFKIVWHLWSMKESAYKIYVQQYQGRFFAPRRMQCKILSKTEGAVVTDNEKYVTESLSSNNFIFTVANSKNDKKVFSKFFKLDDNSYTTQHKETYRKLLVAVSKKWDLPINDIFIKKNKVGAPKLFLNNKKIEVPFSMSHHGSYGSYSIAY